MANYNDCILATTNRNAGVIVRTAVQYVATQARMETLKENSNVVHAVCWIRIQRPSAERSTSIGSNSLKGRGRRLPLTPLQMKALKPLAFEKQVFHCNYLFFMNIKKY